MGCSRVGCGLYASSSRVYASILHTQRKRDSQNGGVGSFVSGVFRSFFRWVFSLGFGLFGGSLESPCELTAIVSFSSSKQGEHGLPAAGRHTGLLGGRAGRTASSQQQRLCLAERCRRAVQAGAAQQQQQPASRRRRGQRGAAPGLPGSRPCSCLAGAVRCVHAHSGKP